MRKRIVLLWALLWVVLPVFSHATTAGLEGKVVKVDGDRVSIELSSPGKPAEGGLVDLFYVTQSGMEIKVGAWRVSEVSGKVVTAMVSDSVSKARVGLKAVFRGAGPGKAEAVREPKRNDPVPKEKAKPVSPGPAEDSYERGNECYFGENGAAKDYVKAAEYFQIAAASGDARAEHRLGVMHQFGLGVTQDYGEAARWYRLSAQKGNASGQYALGVLIANGLGVQKDYAEACRLFRLSADQGYEKAQHNLAVMYSKGWGVQQNFETAAEWYRKAADQGLAPSEYSLGELYEKGLGVPKDEAMAVELYRMAARQGEEVAQKRLKEKGLSW